MEFSHYLFYYLHLCFRPPRDMPKRLLCSGVPNSHFTTAPHVGLCPVTPCDRRYSDVTDYRNSKFCDFFFLIADLDIQQKSAKNVYIWHLKAATPSADH